MRYNNCLFEEEESLNTCKMDLKILLSGKFVGQSRWLRFTVKTERMWLVSKEVAMPERS